MNKVKPLRQLIAIRQRRQEHFDNDVKLQTLQVREAEQQLDQASAQETACVERGRVLNNKRQAMTESSFAPLDLVIADLDVKAATALTQAAAATHAKAQTTVATQLDLLANCKAQALRNLQRIDNLKERVAKALRERAAFEEETDAEESEETAASRIASKRAGREEAQHA
jgi:hypothetical protein